MVSTPLRQHIRRLVAKAYTLDLSIDLCHHRTGEFYLEAIEVCLEEGLSDEAELLAIHSLPDLREYLEAIVRLVSPQRL